MAQISSQPPLTIRMHEATTSRSWPRWWLAGGHRVPGLTLCEHVPQGQGGAGGPAEGTLVLRYNVHRLRAEGHSRGQLGA
jgi:hypothetical protein